MGPQGTGKAKNDPEADKIANAVLLAIKPLFESHSRDMADRLFGSSPTSLQSQITTINERCFGDNPTSLRSRITAREKDDAVSRGKLALLVSLGAGLITFLAIKAQTIAEWFGYVPKHP